MESWTSHPAVLFQSKSEEKASSLNGLFPESLQKRMNYSVFQRIALLIGPLMPDFGLISLEVNLRRIA